MPTQTRLKPRKLPRQARAKATVDTILEAAAQVFQCHGYAAGTTDRIAERAGVSVGSLYQYFPNKDAILVALAERHLDVGFAHMHAILADVLTAAPTLDTLLRTFVDALLALHAHEPHLHRVLFEEAPLPARVRHDLAQREEAFATEIAAVLDRTPGVVLANPTLAAYMLVHIMEGLVHRFILHPPADITTADFTDELVRMLHCYLSP